MVFYFKNTNEDIIMTVKNEEDFFKITIVAIVKKKYYLIKLGMILT